jgi:hypothetical protein
MTNIKHNDPDRMLTLRQAAELTSLSEDTLRRNYPDKIRKLSVRRRGMKLRDVLAIGEKIPRGSNARSWEILEQQLDNVAKHIDLTEKEKPKNV